jgi:hypothetical protein
VHVAKGAGERVRSRNRGVANGVVMGFAALAIDSERFNAGFFLRLLAQHA